MTSLDFMAMLRAERNKKPSKKPRVFEDRTEKIDIADFLLTENAPKNIYYIPNFITDTEEQKLLDAIYETTNSKVDQWTSLTKRRLKNLGGAPHPDGLVKAPLPHYVRQLKQILKQSGLEVGDFVSLDEDSSYNQVLLNEYNDGKGISFHKDGALYHPVALVLSLVSPAVIEFIPQKPERGIDFASQCQVLLEKNSLLIFTDEAYTNLYHGIRDQQQDEILETCLNRKIANVQIGDVIKRGDKRVSLTIRCCAKVSNFSGFSEHQKEEMKRRTAWWIQSINEKE